MLLDKMVKKMSKQLAKIKDVEVYLGKKKVKTSFHRLSDGQFLVEITYSHKKKTPYMFNKIKMVNKSTGKVIKERKLDHIFTMHKGDTFNSSWQVNISCVEEGGF